MFNSAHAVLDFSFAPGRDRDLSDLPFEARMLQELAAEEVRELNVTHAQVLSLTSAPGALINDVLQHVTVLRAAHNSISSLHGIEAFCALEVLDLRHNRLRVVDAHAASLLRTLKQLRSVDFSYNNMSLFDLDGSVGAPSSRATGLGAGAAPSSSRSGSGNGSGRLSLSIVDPSDSLLSLTTMNLSHNAFIDLPSLRSTPCLQVLNMSHNRLDALVDFDMRLPLLSLHSLALHSNQLRTATSLVPLCALAATLKHVQVFRNPFTLMQSRSKAAVGTITSSGPAHQSGGALDESMWWRPFLLWLCPLLVTVDQVEFTAGERRVAGVMLFRENGLLSRSRLEYMNPQRKDDLEAYLRRKSESIMPPHDAMTIIDNIERQEKLQECSRGVRESDTGEVGQMVLPISRMNPPRIREAAPPHRLTNGILTTSPSTYHDPLAPDVVEPSTAETTWVAQSSPGAGDATNRSLSGGRVVMFTGETPLCMSPHPNAVLAPNHSHQRAPPASMTSFVRAVQRKLRSLEEVVAVLWRADLSRRIAAAIVIQRYMRGALARMHLSEEEAECCRFIRYQLQQTTVAQAAHGVSRRAAHVGARDAGGASSGSVATRSANQRHSSLEPAEDTCSNMQEILISMRSLQEVMSNMWADLEEYRAMADREQRRAAVFIQRHYRGYRARCEYGRVLKHRRSSPPPASSCTTACQCASETASLQQVVSELRSEVRELRELLQQKTHQQRLATCGDPEKAIDEIVRKYEQRSSAAQLAEPTDPPNLDDDTQPSSAMPSFTEPTVDVSASQEKAATFIAQDQGLLMKGNSYEEGAVRVSKNMPHFTEQTSSLDSTPQKRDYVPGQPTLITKPRPRLESMENARQAGNECVKLD
ncbi:leucine-rich repeat protein, putative [Leishmania panamensis]|uniref:Leucine-rich repeat protein, putative n=1 Tax=Leishmania panamensis TaxID=5679 RepID=A0A088RUR9_LEIPA|nr:leucine-rich repeat protein, putative [Leishmania panamensis]AIN99907.1 leucine-rich repeat protein, putative [Leishmania panamensis]